MAEISKKQKGWVKGQSGNPNGRPKLSDEERAARRADRQLVVSVLREIFTGSLDDLERELDKKLKIKTERSFLYSFYAKKAHAAYTSKTAKAGDLEPMLARWVGQPMADDDLTDAFAPLDSTVAARISELFGKPMPEKKPAVKKRAVKKKAVKKRAASR